VGNEKFTAAPSEIFRTASGLLDIFANEQRRFETLRDLIERPDLKADERFAERQTRKRNRDASRAVIEERLVARGASDWEALLNAHCVPAGRVLGAPAILDHPQLRERHFVETLPASKTDGESLRVTRPGFRLDEPLPVAASPPALGAETRSRLRHIGRTDDEINQLARAGATAGRCSHRAWCRTCRPDLHDCERSRSRMHAVAPARVRPRSPACTRWHRTASYCDSIRCIETLLPPPQSHADDRPLTPVNVLP
jgi:hypothetical protein